MVSPRCIATRAIRMCDQKVEVRPDGRRRGKRAAGGFGMVRDAPHSNQLVVHRRANVRQLSGASSLYVFRVPTNRFCVHFPHTFSQFSPRFSSATSSSCGSCDFLTNFLDFWLVIVDCFADWFCCWCVLKVARRATPEVSLNPLI